MMTLDIGMNEKREALQDSAKKATTTLSREETLNQILWWFASGDTCPEQ